MYDYIKGTITATADEYIVIENNGIGYRIFTSGNTISRVIKGEKDATVFTYLNVREDMMKLYGFTDREELSIFRMLIGISGIGPKAALSVLSTFTPRGVAIAIASENSKELSRARGIGKKTAQRIILELKDKFKALDKVTLKGKVTSDTSNEITDEARTALMVLGFRATDASELIKKNYKEGITVEGLIMKCLKKLNG